jgi:serine/threonine-protein kinase
VLGQPVAIKVLTLDTTANADRIERFQREAWAAATIKSDHVVRVSDVGALSEGAPYMVMEYLEGEDLEDLVRKGPLPVQTAVDYLLQACEALAEAHALGIVHRDLKPGNLFLTKRADGSAWVKVLDFGISKVGGGMANLTQTSALLGSPLYMAPEQMASAKYVDPRSDIWALGSILFELLAGRTAFTAETLPELITNVLHLAPERLSNVLPNPPAGLDEVVQRCLAKRPDERYQDLAELADALTPFGGVGAPSSAEFIAKVCGTNSARPDANASAAHAAIQSGGRDAPPSSATQVLGAGSHPGVPEGAAQTGATALMATPLPVGQAPVAATVDSTLESAGNGGAPGGATHHSGAHPAVGAGTADAVMSSVMAHQPKRSAAPLVVLGAVGLVAALGVAAMVFSGGSGDDAPAEAAAATSPSAAPAPAPEAEHMAPTEVEGSADVEDAVEPVASASASASASSETKAPTRRPRRTTIRRRPSKSKEWSPFDDR